MLFISVCCHILLSLVCFQSDAVVELAAAGGVVFGGVGLLIAHLSSPGRCVVGHAVVSLAQGGVKEGAFSGGGIRHDRREGQPKPQRKRTQGVRTGEGAREAARAYRALDGWRD